MTVRINFLPKTYQPPKQLGFKEWAAAASVALAVVGTTTYYMSAFAGVARMEKHIKDQQQLHQQVKAGLAQAAEIKSREERIANAKAELTALQGRHWSGILLSLGDLTPQHVTWTDVDIEGDAITLKATARGLVDVAQLFGGLVDHGEIAEVTLKYVNEQGIKVEYTRATEGAAHPAGTEQPKEPIKPMVFPQMEFEMVIRLNPLHEGGQKQNGA